MNEDPKTRRENRAIAVLLERLQKYPKADRTRLLNAVIAGMLAEDPPPHPADRKTRGLTKAGHMVAVCVRRLRKFDGDSRARVVQALVLGLNEPPQPKKRGPKPRR